MVYRVKEGWEPLCKFLGKKIPETPFPRRNVGGSGLAQQINEHEFGRRRKYQTMMSLAVLAVLWSCFVCFLSSQHPALVGIVTLLLGITLFYF